MSLSHSHAKACWDAATRRPCSPRYVSMRGKTKMLGHAISFIFGILSVIFYYKQKIYRSPVFVYKSNILQTKPHPSVSILYEGKKVEGLCQIKINFFNNGKQEIRRDDVPNEGYPRIIFPEGSKLLSVKVSEVSDISIEFNHRIVDERTLELSFDYLNKDDGAVLDILYDCGQNSSLEIVYKARLKGAKEAVSKAFQEQPTIANVLFWIFALGLFVVAEIFTVRSIFIDYESSVYSWKKYMFFAFLISYTIPAIYVNLVLPFSNNCPKWAKKYFVIGG